MHQKNKTTKELMKKYFPKLTYNYRPNGKTDVGRPKKKWLDAVKSDHTHPYTLMWRGRKI